MLQLQHGFWRALVLSTMFLPNVTTSMRHDHKIQEDKLHEQSKNRTNNTAIWIVTNLLFRDHGYIRNLPWLATLVSLVLALNSAVPKPAQFETSQARTIEHNNVQSFWQEKCKKNIQKINENIRSQKFSLRTKFYLVRGVNLVWG